MGETEEGEDEDVEEERLGACGERGDLQGEEGEGGDGEVGESEADEGEGLGL